MSVEFDEQDNFQVLAEKSKVKLPIIDFLIKRKIVSTQQQANIFLIVFSILVIGFTIFLISHYVFHSNTTKATKEAVIENIPIEIRGKLGI